VAPLAESEPSDLAAPVAVGPPVDRPPSDRATKRRFILGRIDTALANGEEHLRYARFEAALASAEEVRPRLERMRRLPDLQERWVRLEVLAATAQLALGDETAAGASLARAIVQLPDLALDPQRTPPKLLRALEAARATAGAQP
jgi:hypothetical protein